MKYKINIILMAILLSKLSFGSMVEIEVQEDRVSFNPNFDDHLKIVGCVWGKSRDVEVITGIFNVEQQEECFSKYVYVDSNNQIYLVRKYQYKIQGKSLDVFLRDQSLQINCPIVLEKGIYEFSLNKLTSLDSAKRIAFLPKKYSLNINQSLNIADLNKTLLSMSQHIIPNQLVINASLTGINASNPKITLYTIILNNIEFNLETALFIAGFNCLKNLQILQCFARSSDPFITILCVVNKLSKLNLSGSSIIPEVFLKHVVSILKIKNFKFVPHDEREFLQYVKQNNNFELFESIVFDLETDSAKEFLIDTMIYESNFDLDCLEKTIIVAIKTGSHLLINKVITVFFQAVWQYHYPTPLIVSKIINLFNVYRDHLQNVENIKYYLSYCYYKIPIINKELVRSLVELMSTSNWDTLGNASYLLYMIDSNNGEEESAIENLRNACNKKNILALYIYAKIFRDNGLFEPPANEEKDLICQKIKDTLCTESNIFTCCLYGRNDLVEYIEEYSQLIDNYFLLRNLI